MKAGGLLSLAQASLPRSGSPRSALLDVDMHRCRTLLVACAVVLSASLAVYHSTAGGGEGSRTGALERLRGASAHAQGTSQRVGHSSEDDGGGALRAAVASGIHISVKTISEYHDTRLAVIMLTWMRSVPDPAQVHIITSGADERWRRVVTGAGFILQNTNCTGYHSRPGLWCKSGAEHAAFFEEREAGKERSWFCHFDDDVYVNFPRLVEVLTSYSPTGRERVYLGLQPPIRRNQILTIKRLHRFPEHKQELYQYAAGAAYCISTALMGAMATYTRSMERFEATCKNLGLPDDLCVGAIIGALIGTNLTDVEQMMSHAENMRTIPARELKQLVTCGYKLISNGGNVLRIPNSTFTEHEDRTRFLSYHCFLHPETAWCRDPPRVGEGGRTTSALYHRVAAASNLQL